MGLEGLLIAPIVLAAWGCWRFTRTRLGEKYGERVLLGLIVLMIIGTPSFLTVSYGHFLKQGDNMRAALIRCGEMLKNGEREVLAQKLAAFVKSPEMDLAPLPFAAAFRKAVGAEEPPPPPWTPPEKTTMIALGVYSAVWFVLLGVWGLMFWRKSKLTKRHGYLILLFSMSLVCVFLAWAGIMVRSGYSGTAIRHDVRGLAEAVSRPEIPPDLLPQLENPEPCGFSYIRLPGAPNPGPFF